ncbi:7665_t:CDS:1, partial [Funneliformis geosporum]
TKISEQNEISCSNDDEEYYTADEGPDNIFNRYCKTCKRDFKYPCRLKHHK